MTNPNLTGNGTRLSLENCLTNIFALTDLAGIRWKRLRAQSGGNQDVLDDPILLSYSRCLKADMLCSWARVPVTDGSQLPSNFTAYAKELWVFWYGDEPPNLQTCLHHDLKEFESGSWETTLLSYECRTFLFKALHNVIERCLLAKQFVRVGKWFVQPHSDAGSDLSTPLSFSFQNFFLHGDSTACVSVDVEKRDPLYRLTSQQVKEAISSSSNPAGVNTSQTQSNHSVILAPYGLQGVLTGAAVAVSDQNQALQDWLHFYPFPLSFDSDLPSMVEVAVGGVRMKYPSAYVLTTQPPKANYSKHKPIPSHSLEKCLSSVVTRTTTDTIQLTNNRRDDDFTNWPFLETSSRTNCNCVKGKVARLKQQKAGSPISPKLESKRSRMPYHRRSPPIEKLISGSTSSVIMHPITTNTPNPASVQAAVDHSPICTPGSVHQSEKHPGSQPPSVRQSSVASEEPNKNTLSQTMQSKSQTLNCSQSAQLNHLDVVSNTDHTGEPVPSTISYIGPQLQAASSGLLKDSNKRPSLPSGPEYDDELETDSLYKYSDLSAWLELPLKRAKPDGEPQPQSYELLEHPLTSAKTELSTTAVTSNPTPIKTESSTPALPKSESLVAVPVIKTEVNLDPVAASLMTSDSLKATMSDLDKMFDSEDEDNITPKIANGHTTSSIQHSSIASGGSSMASAHINGPLSATDLSQIYPTPPSHDNHHVALSPCDPSHHQETAVDVDSLDQSTNTSIYRTVNVVKYLSVSEYQPIELPSTHQMINVPSECHYCPWTFTNKQMCMPLGSVENLPSTIAIHQPSSVHSIRSPPFFPPARTPIGSSHDILQSPASVTSLPPKSVPGLLSVENPATHSMSSMLNSSALPEAVSLLVIMTLSDSMLNLFKDQNFESCNLCVCNMNILGNDSGLYLPREKYEAQYKCSCGFSAVVNRRYGFCTGLFYQDECDIMNHRDDRFDKLKMSVLIEKSSQEINRQLLFHIRDQFGSTQLSLLNYHVVLPTSTISNYEKRSIAEQQDIAAVILSALSTGQYMQDTITLTRNRSHLQCLSKWPLEKSCRESPSSNEVIHLLKSLQGALQEAVQKKRTTSLWDPNARKVTGPLSWQSFYKMAGRNDGMVEPQPIPYLMFSYEDDWLKESPLALQHWDKMMLKPYGGERNVSYIVIAPDNEMVLKSCRRFFQELSETYEQCNLGRHVPYQGLADGVLPVGKKLAASINDKPISDWFNKIDAYPFAQKVKLIARACKHKLAAQISQTPPDVNSPPVPVLNAIDNVFTKPNQPATPNSGLFSPPIKDENTSPDINSDVRYRDSKAKTKDSPNTGFAIYMINPFSSAGTSLGKKTGSSAADTDDHASVLALMMCFQELVDNLPDSIASNAYLHIVPLQSVTYNNSSATPDLNVFKSTALSVYSRIKKRCKYSPLDHSMTGFGPVADNEVLNKPDATAPTITIPPYILAPSNDIPQPDNSKPEDKSRVLFCAYCLSEDQRWLLASVILDNGEMLDTTVINIHISNLSRRRKASVIKQAIQKLFEYLLQTMSKMLFKWRLVIGRFGRLGHSELEEWSKLLSKKALMKASVRLKDSCGACTAPYQQTDRQLSILGASLTSIEPHASFSLLFSDITSKEDKKNLAAPLTTPEDASVTHILVIPNSTTAGGSQSQNEATIDFTGDHGESEELLQNIGLTDDMLTEDIHELFGISAFGDAMGGSPPHSPRGSPTNMLFAHPSGISSRRGTTTSMLDQPAEELVNQQPLATGYMVSTAPTGKLPAWFYSVAPHTENICPTVLKSALHFRTVCAQHNSDDYYSQPPANSAKQNSHALDSSQTCDVLRYVLDSYNRLSWLTVDPVRGDRRSCLPLHIEVLMRLYHAMNSFI